MTALPLREHQVTALGRMKNGCILWGGVGSGKSRVSLEYALEHHASQPIIIITTAKKRDSLDWEKEGLPLGISSSYDAVPNGYMQVDSWNNIQKYVHVENAFFIFDEQRLVGTGGWTKSFIKISKKNDWILLSATPGDTWLDYVGVFIANGFYKNRTAFINRHVVYAPFSKYPKVQRYLEVGHLVKLRNSILVEMKDERHTTRIPIVVPVEFDPADYQRVEKDRWNIREDRPIRDAGELYHGLRYVVNSDPSRLGELHKLLKKHPRIVIFYNFNYELEALRTLSDVITVAEWNGHKHEEVPTTDRWVYLVQYTAGSEGWNCITTDATAFYSLPDSFKKWEQSHGRIDRLNTPYTNLFYYILRSKAGIDKAIWASLGRKENFNMSAYERTL